MASPANPYSRVAGILVILAVVAAVESQNVLDLVAAQQQEVLHLVQGYERILNSIKDECVSSEQLKLLKSKPNVGFGCLGRGSERNIPIGNLPANFGLPCPEMLHDIALNKIASSSSVYERDYPVMAISGNESTLFHSAYEKQPWWLLDLGSERVIYHIMILSRQDCCWDRLYDLEIRLGNDLEIYGDFSSHDLLYFFRGPYRKEDGYLMYTFAQGVRGRYLSLKIVAEAQAMLQLNNVKVIGLRN